QQVILKKSLSYIYLSENSTFACLKKHASKDTKYCVFDKINNYQKKLCVPPRLPPYSSALKKKYNLKTALIMNSTYQRQLQYH
ncbi:MAG: hypothetical protein AAFS12_18765, partial [Cyanobacteria bacterium J06632_19]